MIFFTLSLISFCNSADKSLIIVLASTIKLIYMFTLLFLSSITFEETSFVPLYSLVTPSTIFCIVSFEIINFPFSFANNTPSLSFNSCFEVGSKKMQRIDNKMNTILTPKIIFDDVSPNNNAAIKLPTTFISNHLNTNKHAIIDKINIIFEYITNVIFSTTFIFTTIPFF